MKQIQTQELNFNIILSVAVILTFANCQPQSSRINFFNYSYRLIPHPEKVQKGGEDAQFSNQKILVVADGVGQWTEYDIDSGIYSKQLCKNIEDLFTMNIQYYTLNPKMLIIHSNLLTRTIGSSTVCIMTLDDNQLILRTAYIGDSGYAIFRQQNNEFQLIFKSTSQQRVFNNPYQIGTGGDNPDLAITNQHIVEPFDLVVMGTDGLFDNISLKWIKSILDEHYYSNQDSDLLELANKIAYYAYRLSLDEYTPSPFSEEAKANGYDFVGGKSDDITVIVAQINKGNG